MARTPLVPSLFSLITFTLFAKKKFPVKFFILKIPVISQVSQKPKWRERRLSQETRAGQE